MTSRTYAWYNYINQQRLHAQQKVNDKKSEIKRKENDLQEAKTELASFERALELFTKEADIAVNEWNIERTRTQ
jgi:hypothetical protein